MDRHDRNKLGQRLAALALIAVCQTAASHHSAVAIIDFNDCGWGHYALDLGVMLFDLRFMLDDASALDALCDAVLAGYEEVAPLPLGDPRELDAFVALRGLASLAWIARSPDPAERKRALATRPGMPLIWQALERFV